MTQTIRRISVASMACLFAAAVAHGRSPQQAPRPPEPIVPPIITAPAGSGAVEQTSQGTKPPASLVASIDGLGVGFEGPQGTAIVRNPSDNSLVVGLDHVV